MTNHLRTPHIMRNVLPHILTVMLVIALVITQNVWAAPFQQAFDDPARDVNSTTSMNYQGQLFDASGNPLNGTVNLSFRIYDAPTNGNSLWGPEAHNNTPVVDGLFDVALGDTIPLSASMFGTNRWLQTTVNGETLSPRQQLLSVPVAQVAIEAFGVPNGAITTGDMSPTMWHMITAPMQVNLTSTLTEYASLTIQDTTASHFMVWWGIEGIKNTEAGRIQGHLWVDNTDTGYVIYAQSGQSGAGGANTASGTSLITITPNTPHEIQVLSYNEYDTDAVLRRIFITAMPIYSNSTQTCTASSPASYTLCTVLNLPFTAP